MIILIRDYCFLIMQYFIFISGHIYKIYYIDQYSLVISKLNNVSNDNMWNMLSLITDWKCDITTSNNTLVKLMILNKLNKKVIINDILENNKLIRYKIHDDYIFSKENANGKDKKINQLMIKDYINPIKLCITLLATCSFYIFDGFQIIELSIDEKSHTFVPLYGQKADYLIQFITKYKLSWNKEIKNVANVLKIHKCNDHCYISMCYKNDYIQICNDCQMIKLFSPLINNGICITN